ncbi:MAG: HipA domain-containing protein [Pseudomonadota bacterium]
MKRCPITMEPIENNVRYSKRGLHLLARNLDNLKELPLTAQEQRIEAGARAGKMSIQGLQPKLSAVLKIKEGRFEIVDRNGQYILKPQCDFPEVPENESLTMSLAEMIDIETPVHGLVYSKDGSFTYFIRRFDRKGRKGKVAVEDFAQLAGELRETKYNSSMEKVAELIKRYCSFPRIEFAELFKRTIFNYLIGNEDMHLKNFSLITIDEVSKLAPAYDFVNSTIALANPREELALPLHGKKTNLTRDDFLIYYARQRLELNEEIIFEIMKQIEKVIPKWNKLIESSYLSPAMKTKYLSVLAKRQKVLFEQNK